MTERLYYQDCYLRSFARAWSKPRTTGGACIWTAPRSIPLPAASRSTPVRWAARNVIEVIDEEERVAHVLDAPIAAGEVGGQIDWPRRFDHMQQHSGQHLLSAVLEELFKIPTVSFHLGAEVCTIDVTAPSLATAVRSNEPRTAAPKS